MDAEDLGAGAETIAATPPPAQGTPPPPGRSTPPPANGGTPPPAASKDGAPAAKPNGMLADGDLVTAPEAPQDWPDDWRNKLSADDKKSLKTLERFASPQELYKSYAEMRSAIDSGKYVRRPATRATAEEKAAFNKALGIPDAPEAYLEGLKLSDGRVLGDDDKPIAEVFAKRLHEHGVTPAAYSAMVDTYLDLEQSKVDLQIQGDTTYKVESQAKLKQEMGAAFQEVPGVISSLLAQNKEFKEVLLSGRGADGQLLGNNPLVIKTLYAIGKELHPNASMHGVGADDGKSIDTEIAELEKKMRDRRAWSKDEAAQSRYRDLLGARERYQSRRRA